MTTQKDELTVQITLLIGAHWQDSFVPLDDLTEATNEFLRLPHCEEFLELVKDQRLRLLVSTKAEHNRTGCWLSFERL
jgi:hypothetical protein